MFYLHFEGTKKVWMGSDNETGPNDALKRVVWARSMFFFLFRVIHILTIFIYIFRHKKGWGAQQQ